MAAWSFLTRLHIAFYERDYSSHERVFFLIMTNHEGGQMNMHTGSKGYWLDSLLKSTNSSNPYYATGKELYLKVVGVQYDGRLQVVAKLKINERVLLRREPTNPYDSNAIRVERLTGEQIGFFKRKVLIFFYFKD